MNLSEIIPDVAAPSGGGLSRFVVVRVPDSESHYVGRDSKGQACLLLSSVDHQHRAPVRLSGLEVAYAASCVVELAGEGISDETLTVIRCTSTTDDIERYFLQVMGMFIGLIGSTPTLEKISEVVVVLAGLFQRLSVPPRKGATGLIGELVTISVASDIHRMMTAWRNDPQERYDFAEGNIRLEAKATASRRRVHALSYEQADVPGGCLGILVSVFVESSAGGTSLAAFVDSVSRKLGSDAEAVMKLYRVVADTLGSNLTAALNFSFDENLATSSIEYYDLSVVPAVRGKLAAGVSAVKFETDLSRELPTTAQQLQSVDIRSRGLIRSQIG